MSTYYQPAPVRRGGGAICRHPAPSRVCTPAGVICSHCGSRLPALRRDQFGGRSE